jgi:K+-sensing histidine kinase KdpD
MLGAHLHVEEGDDVADVAIETARSLGSTYVLIGRPAPRRGLARLRPGGESLLGRLLEGLPGVDIRIVADPSLRRAAPADKDLVKGAGVPGEGGEASERSA